MTVAAGARSRLTPRGFSKFLLGLVALTAMAAPLAGCGGSSGRTDSSYWRSLYGDPDTSRPDTGSPLCCRHSTRSN